MIDRLIFERSVLPNGATLYLHSMDVPFTTVYLMVPVGLAHGGVGSVISGSPHFLEHIMHGRSQKNSQRSGLDLAVGMTGGWTNAHTSLLWTTYELSVPNRHLTHMLPLLCSAVFEPLFLDEDLEQQCGVIANERQLERWWPGSGEITQYMRTGWQLDDPVSLDRTFGTDYDLAAISKENLRTLHSQYFDKRIKIIVVGSGDVSSLVNFVSDLRLDAEPLEPQYQPLSWVKREYHEKAFRDSGSYELLLGGIISQTPDMEAVCVSNMILNYLCNSTHGALYAWLRNENGWIYDINWSINQGTWGVDWGLSFDLNEMEQVQTVRKELWPRMEQAILDTDRVRLEIQRLRDKTEAFYYQIPDDIMEAASADFRVVGHIITETQWDKYLERCLDPTYLLTAFHRYFDQAESGSFCAVPEPD